MTVKPFSFAHSLTHGMYYNRTTRTDCRTRLLGCQAGKREMCSHECERERRSILFEREKAEVEICMKRDLGSDISSLEFHTRSLAAGAAATLPEM